MIVSGFTLLALWLALAPSRAAADVRGCDCKLNDPESMQKRECSLCREAELQPAGVEFFVLRDANPRKPNRWLVLPKTHLAGSHPLHLLSKSDRTRRKIRSSNWCDVSRTFPLRWRAACWFTRCGAAITS